MIVSSRSGPVETHPISTPIEFIVLSENQSQRNRGGRVLFKIYEGGKVRRKERDSNGDGRVDYWEYLDEKGVVQKVGRDVDGDGVMDIRED